MRIVVCLVVAAVALAAMSNGAAAGLIANPTSIDRVHVDLCFPYVNGAWDIHIRADLPSGSQSFRANEAVLVAGDDAKVMRPDEPQFDPIGVSVGEPLWIMSQSGDIGLYLGFEASFNYDRTASMNLSHIQAWDADGPAGFNPPQKVVEIALVDVRGPGEFAMWFSYFEGPRFYMSTADGIDSVDAMDDEDGDDEYWQFVGGHSHVNWGFTAPGMYEIDFQGRTVLANGNEVRSDVATFYFSVARPPTGDFNSDGVVDGSDFLIWQRSLGSAGDDVAGDGNYDGVVDGDDLAVWKSQFGLNASAVARSQSVPEPNSLGLSAAFVLAIAGACGRRQRGFRRSVACTFNESEFIPCPASCKEREAN